MISSKKSLKGEMKTNNLSVKTTACAKNKTKKITNTAYLPGSGTIWKVSLRRTGSRTARVFSIVKRKSSAWRQKSDSWFPGTTYDSRRERGIFL